MTDATNSPNFYVGRSADVGDMLLHGQIVIECHAQIFCLQGKQNISVFYSNAGWWGFGREVLFETMSRHSVLSSFSLSLFDVIHVFTSEMQSCMPWTEVSIWSGRQESCSWVSSAKDWLEMECRRISVVKVFVYKMNRIGPRTEPCGTPKLSKVGCGSLLLMVTVWVLSER